MKTSGLQENDFTPHHWLWTASGGVPPGSLTWDSLKDAKIPSGIESIYESHCRQAAAARQAGQLSWCVLFEGVKKQKYALIASPKRNTSRETPDKSGWSLHEAGTFMARLYRVDVRHD
jgi:hypothetical protein